MGLPWGFLLSLHLGMPHPPVCHALTFASALNHGGRTHAQTMGGNGAGENRKSLGIAGDKPRGRELL